MIVATLARGLTVLVGLGLFAIVTTTDLSPARAQSLDDLYAKAKGEAALAFYAGGPTTPWEARCQSVW